jgi:hypothetical protein
VWTSKFAKVTKQKKKPQPHRSSLHVSMRLLMSQTIAYCKSYFDVQFKRKGIAVYIIWSIYMLEPKVIRDGK